MPSAPHDDHDTPATSGMLSLLEMRRRLLREASTLSARAERFRKRGDRMLAARLRRRALQLWSAAQRMQPPSREQ